MGWIQYFIHIKWDKLILVISEYVFLQQAINNSLWTCTRQYGTYKWSLVNAQADDRRED